MTTDARKALHMRIASAMETAAINYPNMAATIALNIIRDEFLRHSDDIAAANDLAMVLMGADE